MVRREVADDSPATVLSSEELAWYRPGLTDGAVTSARMGLAITWSAEAAPHSAVAARRPTLIRRRAGRDGRQRV